MTSIRFAYQILVCIVVLSRITCVVSEPYGKALGGHYGIHEEKEHIHSTERPCAVCPRQGVCVPHVQCPAHVRPGSHNPQCHLDGTRIGVCCFTGRSHAAESDRKFRSSVNVEDVKAAHNQSRLKLQHWLQRAEELQKEPYAVINSTAPSYGHHLSLVTYDKRAQKLGVRGVRMSEWPCRRAAILIVNTLLIEHYVVAPPSF